MIFGEGYCHMKIKVFILVFGLYAVTTCFAFERETSAGVDLLEGAQRSVAYIEKGVASEWQKDLSTDKGEKENVGFRVKFQVEDPCRFAGLALDKPTYINDLRLNGRPVPIPIEGMLYKSIPGIPSSLLVEGENELQAIWESGSGRRTIAEDIDIHLRGLPSSAFAFQTGPVLGYAGDDFFTVSCRINMPAEVVLEVDGREFTSKSALLHSFKVDGLKAGTQYEYSMKARLSGKDEFTASMGPCAVRTFQGDKPFVFAILGDSRTNPEDWAKVAAAVAAEKPVFSVFAGDMVTMGKNDYEWDEQYFGPAKEFFATIPYYAVIGNHERNCPLFDRIFLTPAARNWSQEIGSVLLIGIDGSMDWASGSELAVWLEKILSETKAKYIFLVSHYPAWTSGSHGSLDKGRPSEKEIRYAQDVLMPLLKKYNATAMVAGHDHIYERSEPDDGVTMIVVGGAGAPLRGKALTAKKQNPYSKVFASKLHYGLISVDEDVCTMRVLTPEGKEIDAMTWPAIKR